MMSEEKNVDADALEGHEELAEEAALGGGDVPVLAHSGAGEAGDAGAGTFLPVKSETIGGHPMHSEPFSVSRRFVEMLRDKDDRPLTAVGTTSTRCLESLYFIS